MVRRVVAGQAEVVRVGEEVAGLAVGKEAATLRANWAAVGALENPESLRVHSSLLTTIQPAVGVGTRPMVWSGPAFATGGWLGAGGQAHHDRQLVRARSTESLARGEARRAGGREGRGRHG